MRLQYLPRRWHVPSHELLQANYCTRSSRKNAIVFRPLRTIASHELLHELLQQKTAIAVTPLPESTPSLNSQSIRVGFGRTDFARIFVFGPPDFFLRGFCRQIFSSFLREKCPEKSSRKIPGKSLQNLYNKIPRQVRNSGVGGWVSKSDPHLQGSLSPACPQRC